MAEETTKSNNPAFTGDMLYHERLDILLKKAYSLQTVADTTSLASVVTNILAEIYRYMDQVKASCYRKRLKLLKSSLIEFNARKQKVVTSSRVEYKILGDLEEILFDLVVFAHEAKLILRDKGSMDDAFGDLS